MAESNRIISSANALYFNAQSIYHFRKQVQSAYHNIQDCYIRLRVTYCAELLSFADFLNVAPGNRQPAWC